MITVSLSLNAAAFTATSLTGPMTLRDLAIQKFGHPNATAKLNGAVVPLTTMIGHADQVSLVAAAAPAPVVAAAPAAETGFIQVTYINNNGEGFAERLTVVRGLTISRLLSQKGVDPSGFRVTVNNDIVAADTILNNGDKISVVPVKVEGAAEVLYINNNGEGFAERKSVIDGITVRQFFAQQTQSADPARFKIMVNNFPATPDQVLNNGDKVSVTPLKIQGALA